MKTVIFRFTSLFLLIFMVSGVSAEIHGQNKNDMKKAKNLVKLGDRSFNKKDYQAAIQKYAEAIALVGNYADAHFWKGNAHYYLKDYDLALSEINIAYDQGFKPLNDLYRIRWFLNYTKKNYDAAISDLNNGLQLEPDNLSYKLGLGDVYYANQSWRDAVNVYTGIVSQVRNNGNTYYNLADSYYRLGETDAQKTAAENAVNNGTQFMSESYFLIGKAHQKNRKYAEAANAYEKSINVKRDSYDTYRSLSDVYRNLNRFDDAVKITKEALVVFPNDGILYTDLSWYFSLADKHPEAVGAAEIAISFLPNTFQAYTYLCRGQNDMKEYQKAIAACNEALKLNPDDGETNFYLGRALGLAGKADQSPKMY